MGLPEEAVEILACVLADPVADQKMLNDTETIRETAQASLEFLSGSLALDVFEAVRLRGAAKSLEVGAKELLAG